MRWAHVQVKCVGQRVNFRDRSLGLQEGGGRNLMPGCWYQKLSGKPGVVMPGEVEIGKYVGFADQGA